MSGKLLAVALLSAAAGLCGASVAQAQPLELSVGLGLGKPTGDSSESFDPDVGGAVSLGARLHPNFGVAFRMALDRLGPDAPLLADASMWMGRLQLEPAAHVVQNRVDFSLGPTFGLYYLSGEVDGPGAFDSSGNSRGFTLGARVNLLFRVSNDVALGPYFAYDRLFPTKSCIKLGNAAEACDDDPDNDQGFWQLGLVATF